MLLDIQNFAQNQRERQNLLNQEVDLAFKQLCKTIEDVPTTEFDIDTRKPSIFNVGKNRAN